MGYYLLFIRWVWLAIQFIDFSTVPVVINNSSVFFQNLSSGIIFPSVVFFTKRYPNLDNK